MKIRVSVCALQVFFCVSFGVVPYPVPPRQNKKKWCKIMHTKKEAFKEQFMFIDEPKPALSHPRNNLERGEKKGLEDEPITFKKEENKTVSHLLHTQR